MANMVTVHDLGYANGWQNGTPEIVRQCREKFHNREVTTVGKCLTQYKCEQCGYVYLIDSSD